VNRLAVSLLGAGPRARGGDGLSWLGPRADRVETPGLPDRSGALPAPLREFVRGGPAPSAQVRLVTSPGGSLAPAGVGPAPAGAAPPAGSDVGAELIRPSGPVVIQAPPRSPAMPAQAAPPSEAAVFGGASPVAGRRVARPRAGGAVRGPAEMEHTSLVAGAAGGGVLRKASAVDTDPGGDQGSTSPSREVTQAEGSVPTAPADLSLLVNQIYAQLKRELLIERERKG
jgi:hypothetical protein